MVKDKCPYCDGLENVYIERDDTGQDFEFTCPSCCGTGRKNEGDYIECPFCDGKGEVEIENSETKEIKGFICPACHGADYVNEDLLAFWEEEG
jgi:RecJ-like exonuclease